MTQEQLYLVTPDQLQLLGTLSDVFKSNELLEPKRILLATDCYEIFIAPAHLDYSSMKFLSVAEENFLTYFPHLSLNDYKILIQKPQFNSPYLCIAIKKYWLDQCIVFLNQRKFHHTQIEPLATYLFEKNRNHHESFVAIEPNTMTQFIKVNGELDLVFRRNVHVDDVVDFKTWMSLK